MNKLVFLTGEDLLDVDMPIVKRLNASYDIFWLIVLKGYGWFTRDQMEKFCRENYIQCLILDQNKKLKHPSTIKTHLRILRILKETNARLIYDSYLGVPFMHFFTPLFLPERKFVIAIHDVVQHHKMGNRGIRSFYYDFLMKRYTNIHLFSQNQLRVFNNKYKNKNTLLAPLVLKDFGPPQVSPDAQAEDQCNFLFFGIIRENKGVDLLIKAANLLSKKNKDFTITIAGKSADGCWDRYKDLIEDQDRFNLIIRTISNEEVAELMSKAKFLVLPYRDITQSGVLLSAYNYDLPILASRLPGFEEYIEDGKTGFLFDSDDVASLASAMERSTQLTSGEYKSIRANLSAFIQSEISVEAVAEKYKLYFDRLMLK